jgi:hemerythrin
MTTSISWKPFYSVGVASVDAQHKQILDAINKLCAALERGNEQAVLQPLLDQLVQYTDVHFKHEEQLIEEHGYPKLTEHKALHAQLRKRTVDLRAYMSLVTAHDLLGFLKNSWLDHIQSEDKQYAPYLQVPVHS